MSEYTFTDVQDLTYELNDTELFNDVLSIIGDPGEEVSVRGYSPGSIAKYGRRTYRLPVPLGATQEIMQGLVEDALDKMTEPRPIVEMTIVGDTTEKAEQILTRKLSDVVTVQCHSIFLDDDFYIEGIDFSLIGMIPVCRYTLSGVNGG